MKTSPVAVAITVLFLTGFGRAVMAQNQGSAYADAAGDRDVSHKVSFPVQVDSWGAVPPTVRLDGYVIIDVANQVVVDNRIPPNSQPKFIVTPAADPNSLNVIGKVFNDGVSARKSAIHASAAGTWITHSTTIDLTSGVNNVTIDMATTAMVNPIDPPPKYVAVAGAQITDPFPFPALAPGESINLDTTLGAGQTLAATLDGQASRRFFVGSDLPGYETLYDLNVSALEVNGTPTLSADFTSHAQLGLDDAAVAASVTGAFTFDAVEQRFTLGNDLSVFSGALPLPAGQPFNLYVDATAAAEVGGPIIIEPPDTTKVIMSPTSVLGTDLGTFAGTALDNIINHTGIDPFVSGVTSFDDYIDGAQPADGTYTNTWQSNFLADAETEGYIDFDFGDTQTIDRLAMWNGKMQNISVLVSDSPDGSWQAVDDFTLDPKLGVVGGYFAEVLEFDTPVDARYLRIQVNSVYPFLRESDNIWYAIIGEIAASVAGDATVTGDFNVNGVLDSGDIDLLTKHIREGGLDTFYDVNLDGIIDDADLVEWVHELKNTYFGDANLDDQFDSTDLVEVLASGMYDADIDATWSTGDFDGSGRSDSGDLVRALADGGYDQGPRQAVAAVPEPSAALLVTIGLLAILKRRRSNAHSF